MRIQIASVQVIDEKNRLVTTRALRKLSPRSCVPSGGFWRRAFYSCYVAVSLFFGSTVRGQSANPPDSILAGCEPDYPPYCIVDATGRAGGFSVELLRSVLKTMGETVSFHVDDWSQLRSDLAEGRIRVLPLVGRTPEREKIYDFTFPYLTMHGTLVVRKDQNDLRSLEDLKGRQVAVLKGDNAEEFLRRKTPDADIVTLPSFEAALQALSEGQYDAVAIQRLLALHLMKKAKISNLKITGIPSEQFKQTFCFAVRKGDTALLAKLNEGLSVAMHDGTFRSLSAKWFSEIEESDSSQRNIVVSGDKDFPPYEFVDEKGIPAGFSVDLTKAIARHIGVEVEFKLGSWSDVRSSLEQETIDLVQTMIYSETRAKIYDFSQPHSSVQYAVATRREMPTISRLEDLTGQKIAVMKSNLMHELAVQQGYETNLVIVATQEEALRALHDGVADYALVGKISAYFWTAKNDWKDIKVSNHSVLSAECCYATLPANKALLERFSEGLAIVKQTGEYRELTNKWLSPYEPHGVSLKKVVTYLAVVAIPLVAMLVFAIIWSRLLRRQVMERTRDLATEAEGHRRSEIRAQAALDQTQYLLKAADKARHALLSVIEDQKATAIKLSDSEGRFGSLYNSMSEGVAIHRIVYDSNGKAEDYEVESINPAHEKLFGFTATEAVGKRATEIFGEKNMLSLAVCANVAETGVPQHFEVTSPSGDRFFSVSLSSPQKGRFAVLFQDITDRNKAAEDHKRLMAVIEQVGEGIVITDPVGVVLYVNPAFVAIRGYTPEEIVGKRLGSIKSGENDPAKYKELWSTISSGETWIGRLINRRKDGTLYTEESMISPVFDKDGKIMNYVAASRDITDQLRMADQLSQSQRLESIGRLAGGVAHDFNNMLGVILGTAELAMDRTKPDDLIFGDLQEIRRAAERSASLTRQLLAFAHKQTVTPQVVDLNDAVSATLTMLRRLIGEDIELLWHPSAGNATVMIDPTQIDQILTNLAVNARDAISGVGQITIKTSHVTFDSEFCESHANMSPGDYVLLAVSDTGCGMDEQTIKNIFEPFFTTKRVGEGTGLGLPTVYGIVQQNKGFINVYSEFGLGTTFKIYLRYFVDTSTVVKKQRLPALKMGSETVLLVEDEEAILRMSETMLTKLGYTVITANTPARAVSVVEASRANIDLLVTDMIMPGMNGRELSEKLKKLRPAMKCLFMSGYTADAISNDNVITDGIHFLEKPFSIRDLAEKLREVLDLG